MRSKLVFSAVVFGGHAVRHRSFDAQTKRSHTIHGSKGSCMTAHHPTLPRPTTTLSKQALAEFGVRRDGLAAMYCLSVIVGIVGAFMLCMHVQNMAALLIAFIFIGGFQHHLSVIHHESIHYLLFRSRKLNEWVGSVLGAYPLGFTMAYRQTHLAHHYHLGHDEEDPDYPNYASFPATWRVILPALIRDMIGLSAARQLMSMSLRKRQYTTCLGDRPARKELLSIALTQIAMFALLVYVGHGTLYFLIWLLPLATWTRVLTRLRSIAEHVDVVDSSHTLPRWRTLYCNPIESFFLAPMNFNYHAEHHLYPHVPFYHLPELHRHLMHNPEYVSQIDIRHGYLRFLLTSVWINEYPAPITEG